MGTSADYARWIIANADKKGTPDFDTVAKAYQAAKTSEGGAPSPAAAVTPSAATVARVDGDQTSQDAKAGPSMLGELGRQVGNLGAGAIRGAGSIGATLMYPIDKATDIIKGDRGRNLSSVITGKELPSRNEERRAEMDNALTSLGADTSSPAFKVGKLGGEIAGTAGVGPAIAGAARAAPIVAEAAPNLLRAIETGGMSANAARAPLAAAAGAGNAITRVAGGTINGGVSAGLVDPGQTGAGAVVGGIVPGATKLAGTIGNAVGAGASNALDSTAKRLMQSAIKPTIKQLQSGDADIAVQTLLDHGINPTKGGVDKLRALIDDKNAAISNAISSSSATIPKQNVISALAEVKQKFGNQVSPTGDLAAIQGVENDFTAHPNFPGADIPVQAAQDMKQGTYSVLRGKYGQVGSAETEAQKGLARGLKDEIASAVPGVGPLNAEESRLLTTLSVAERRALMEMNKNPLGLATLAHNPLSWAAFMADKSALFKSLAARAVNSATTVPGAVQNAIGSQPALAQLGYRAAPNALTGQ